MGAIRRRVWLGAVALGLLLFATALPLAGAPTVAAAAGSTSVATTTITFVDTSRPTPPWDGMPAKPSRTLVTSIWYPARASGSVAASGDGPYPLIVFAHGLGGSPQQYQQLLIAWAAAGYVVAAPLFPLSSSETPGGPDGGDIGNQPGDMSFVIDQVLRASAAASGPLSGLVDPNEIGAAGHSNGAITTLGLVANSCCRDARVKAAVVMAGTTEGLGRGSYQLTEAPPLLVVSDVHDGLVPYADAVAVFNQARGPKALLALDWDSSPDSTGSTATWPRQGSSARRQARSSSQRLPSSMPSSSTNAGRSRPSRQTVAPPCPWCTRPGLRAPEQPWPSPNKQRSTCTQPSHQAQA